MVPGNEHLIKRLENVSENGVNMSLRELARKTVAALEALQAENERTTETVRRLAIENDTEVERLTAELSKEQIAHQTTGHELMMQLEQLSRERDAFKVDNATLLQIVSEGVILRNRYLDEIEDLRAKLMALEGQEPVIVLNANGYSPWEIVQTFRVLPTGRYKLYLAAGATPAELGILKRLSLATNEGD